MRRFVLPALALFGCSKAAPQDPAPAASAPAPAASSADAVSAASELYDAGPSVIGSDKVDGAALRKRHVERLKQDRSPVTLLTGKSPRALGEAICERVMPRRPKATPILLKPNLCGFDGIVDPEKRKGDDGVVGRTTDVEFTRGVVTCLKKRGHQRITIAEGCGISNEHWQRVVAITGYQSMAKEEGVELVAMDDDGVYDVEGDRPGLPLPITGIAQSRVPTLLMPKVLAQHLDRGLFVSLPKVKAHRFSVTSMAIKGMQGTVMLSDARPAYKQKFRTHRELNEQIKAKKAARAADAGLAEPAEERKAHVGALMAFAERMADVLEISTPDVVLAEGAPGMGGDGFWQLYPTDERVAIGGTHPVSVDRAGAELLGLWNNPRLANELGGHKTSPLITVAAKRYGLDLNAVTFDGDAAELLGRPRPFHFRSMAGFELHSSPSEPWQPTRLAAPAASPEAIAVALGGDSVKLDGEAGDAVWSRAPAVAWDTDWSGAATGIVTRARFAWSSAALYVLFELESAGLNVDRSRPVGEERDKLYQEDCVEIFFGHDATDPKHYAEIELGPFGHWFDLDVKKGGVSDTAWSSGLTTRTTRDPSARRAVIEARITAKEILAALRPGARVPLGLYRMDGAGARKYLAFSPTRTRKPNFHVPEKFGVLVVQ
ncbi:MAG: DUF362 domain-containing protein [Myxococcales bacterium]|nr:DUF362 domain-containing protein [Myxococcales bacterium]